MNPNKTQVTEAVTISDKLAKRLITEIKNCDFPTGTGDDAASSSATQSLTLLTMCAEIIGPHGLAIHSEFVAALQLHLMIAYMEHCMNRAKP